MSPENEILIAADCRISWQSDGSVSPRVADRLQKIYFVNDEISIAFATNSIRTIRRLLGVIKKNFGDHNLQARMSHRRAVHIKRALPTFLNDIKVPTELFLAYTSKYNNKDNMLVHYRWTKKGFAITEIKPGYFKTGGSLGTEHNKASFDEIIKKSIHPTKTGIEAYIRSQWLLSTYDVFQRTQNKLQWKTIGPILQTAFSENGFFDSLPYTTTTIMIDNTDEKFGQTGIDFDVTTGRYFIINNVTGQIIKLNSLETAILDYPVDDNERFHLQSRC